jgi:hypothetical protein
MSNTTLALTGWLWVNLPVTLIILIALFGISAASLPFMAALLASGALGWAFWYWAIGVWIRWAAARGVEEDRILRVGRAVLLLRDRSPIDRVLPSNK